MNVGGGYEGNANDTYDRGNARGVFSQDISIEHESSPEQCNSDAGNELCEEHFLSVASHPFYLQLFPLVPDKDR